MFGQTNHRFRYARRGVGSFVRNSFVERLFPELECLAADFVFELQAAIPQQQHALRAERQDRNEDDQLDGAHFLTPPLAVVPGQHDGCEPAEEHRDGGGLADPGWPQELLGDHVEHFEHQPGAGEVADRPLDDLALLQALQKREHVRADDTGERLV